MALQDLLDLSVYKERKKIGISQERIQAVMPHLRNYIAFVDNVVGGHFG